MPQPSALGEFDQLVLLAVVRLDDGAYGMPIRVEIEQRCGRGISLATVYAALDRLEKRDLVRSWMAEPTPERGGRAKRFFRITRDGAATLWEARTAMERMWDGLEAHPDLQR